MPRRWQSRHPECPSDVAPPTCRIETGLSLRRPGADRSEEHRNGGIVSYRLREQLSLVKAAASMASEMERHGHDKVRPLARFGESVAHHARHGRYELEPASELERTNRCIDRKLEAQRREHPVERRWRPLAVSTRYRARICRERPRTAGTAGGVRRQIVAARRTDTRLTGFRRLPAKRTKPWQKEPIQLVEPLPCGASVRHRSMMPGRLPRFRPRKRL